MVNNTKKCSMCKGRGYVERTHKHFTSFKLILPPELGNTKITKTRHKCPKCDGKGVIPK